jgi:ubiquinol-cytochrome c reductase cytochrome b subunit
LIAYAILRAIPNKLGGVLALFASILILFICPIRYLRKFRGFVFYPLNKWLFWVHINVWILLTWLGARPVEEPFIVLGQILSIIYFSYYFTSFYFQKFWDFILSF